MFKKITNLVVSLSMIFSQNYRSFVAVSALLGSSSAFAKPTKSIKVSDETENLNAQCLIYYDIYKNEECTKYYKDTASDSIESLKNGDDFSIFLSCLSTTCGSYPSKTALEESTYPYIMETVKGCKLETDKTVEGRDLISTDWYYGDGTEENPTVSNTSSQKKMIPYKLLQYQCPYNGEVDVCTNTERIQESPVMCFKSGVASSLQKSLSDCLEKQDSTACETVSDAGGISNYVNWVYCDYDNDNDGFNERLSSDAQTACNRADAADLRCTKNSICTIEATCIKKTDKVVKNSSVRTCKDLARNFEEFTVNTQCGDQTDIYRENKDCVRINSLTDSLQDNSVTIGFASGEGYSTDDYTEFVVYRRKDNFVHDELLAALFFPYSMAKTKKGYYIINLNVSAIAKFFGAKLRWEDNGLDTVLDNLYKTTIDYCNETQSCEVKHENDIKSWTWKEGSILKKKYTRVVMQSVVYTEPFVSNLDILQYHWRTDETTEKEGRYTPLKIDYTMQMNLQQNDILVVYDTNSKPTAESFVSTKIDTYYGTNSCEDGGNVLPIHGYKELTKTLEPTLSTGIDIYSASFILPHAGTYQFELFNNNTYLDTIVKYLPVNDGTNYPLVGVDLLSTNLDYNAFSDEFKNKVITAIPSIVDEKIKDYDALIDNTTNNILRILKEANKYQLDEDKHIDYLEDLKDSNASLIYSLLEEKLYEEKLSNSSFSSAASATVGTFPELIDDKSILKFEPVIVDTTKNSFDEGIESFEVARISSLDEKRVRTTFLNKIDSRLEILLKDLDDKRLTEVLKQTKDVYDDFQEVEDTVRDYLNKSSSRYSTTTAYGNYEASFKSECGDYQTALDNLETHYKDAESTTSLTYFQDELDTIKNKTRNMIKDHLDDLTITYKYQSNTRDGVSKWDDWHSRVSGSYSCTYDSTCYNSCLTTYDCNCVTTTDDEGGSSTSCGSCCSGGYEPCTKTQSGACNTYGTSGSLCTGQCSGYVNAHYGSQVNPSGDSESDVNNDYDNSCNGSYTWYTTNDNYGIEKSKKINGTTSGIFKSWGGYSCDDYSVTPTGTDSTTCQTSGHDLTHWYDNTIPASDSSWTSTAKKLNVTTSAIVDELDVWMKNNNHRDSESISPYISGDDNVRYRLATEDGNGVSVVSDNYIKPLIENKVREIMKDYLTLYYTNLVKLDGGRNANANKELYDKMLDIYKEYYEAYFGDNFKPFNRMIIKDLDISPNNKNSINFDITLPAATYIKNPSAFSISIVPSNQIRKYRCYTTWQNCDLPNNCTQTSEKETNFVTDRDNKNVSTMKDVVYSCEDESVVNSCDEMKIYKECETLDFGNLYSDYDDKDFSKDFFKGVGQSLAFNDSIKIFGAQELRCESGLYSDFSWLEDPMFWMSALSAAYSANIGGFQTTVDGAVSWAGEATGITEGATRSAGVVGSAPSALGELNNADTLAEISSSGIEASAGTFKYAKEVKTAAEIGGALTGGDDKKYANSNIPTSTGTNECSDFYGSCLVELGHTPASVVGNMFDDSNNPNNDPDLGLIKYKEAEDTCLDMTHDWSENTDGMNCAQWVNGFRKGEMAYLDELEKEHPSGGGGIGVEQAGGAAVAAISYSYPVAGFIANVAMKLITQTFDSCDQCVDKECASSHNPKEAMKLLKLTNALNVNNKFTGDTYGLGSDFIAYNNCFYKDTGCASKFLSSCVRDFKTYCCYNGRITRMLAGQIYQQLGYNFKADGCSAIELEDLSSINFSPCADNVIPNPNNKCINYEEMKDYMLKQMNWNTQKSFNTSTVINAAINAGKMME